MLYVGASVHARYVENGKFYPATISKIEDDKVFL